MIKKLLPLLFLIPQPNYVHAKKPEVKKETIKLERVEQNLFTEGLISIYKDKTIKNSSQLEDLVETLNSSLQKSHQFLCNNLEIGCLNKKNSPGKSMYNIAITNGKYTPNTIFSTDTGTNTIRINYQRGIKENKKKINKEIFGLYGFHEMLHVQSYQIELENEKKYREIYSTIGEYYYILKHYNKKVADKRLSLQLKNNPKSFRSQGLATGQNFLNDHGEENLRQLIRNYITTPGQGAKRLQDSALKIHPIE
ncbi:MAG: hypothetical protein ACI8RP_001141 [Urechidicola sp.]|jgi:hypothetical protein